MDDGTNLTLADLGEGALEEQFALAIDQVLTNIGDPNTEAKKQRRVDIKVTFSPTKNRDYAAIDITVTPVLVGRAPVTTSAALERRGTKIIAREPRQQHIDYGGTVSRIDRKE
jgi:hypothetical protein